MRHNPAPDVSSRYGSPMGRASAATQDLDTTHPLFLVRIRLNSGGYDAGGAYWGVGLPLYCANDHTGAATYFRARGRDAAKAHLRATHVHGAPVRFYR